MTGLSFNWNFFFFFFCYCVLLEEQVNLLNGKEASSPSSVCVMVTVLKVEGEKGSKKILVD